MKSLLLVLCLFYCSFGLANTDCKKEAEAHFTKLFDLQNKEYSVYHSDVKNINHGVESYDIETYWISLNVAKPHSTFFTVKMFRLGADDSCVFGNVNNEREPFEG